jgi:hypothetical protein
VWSNFAQWQKILRRILLLTGGFTLISIGLGMKFGLWVGLVSAGVLTVILQWHLDRDG